MYRFTIHDLSVLCNEELIEIQDNSFFILNYFHHNFEKDHKLKELSRLVDVATTYEECHIAYLKFLKLLSDRAYDVFVSNTRLTINDFVLFLKK